MSLAAQFGDLILPLVTPFDRSGALDFATLERLIAHALGQRLCDSLWLAGTTGEFYALSFDERLELFRQGKAMVGGRVRLMAGTGAATTREAVQLTEQAERIGYDAVAVILPYFGRPTQEEIYRHLATVARATGLPVILYNIPIFAGVNLQPETLARLAELPNIAGVKDQAGANPVQTSEYLRAAPHLTVYCGDDTMILPVLAQGGAGAVSGGAHIVGDLIREMIRIFKAGDVDEATRLHHRLTPFHRALAAGERINPIPMIRAAIRLASGIDVGPPRPPLLPATGEEEDRLREVLAGLGRLRPQEVVRRRG